MKHKKAMMDDWMDVAFTFIMGFIIFFFVYNLTTIPRETEADTIQKDTEFLNYEATLLQFAKSPIKERNTADIISGSYLNQDFIILDQHTQFFFKKYNLDCWGLRISKADVEIHFIQNPCFITSPLIIKTAELFTPAQGDPSNPMKLELFIGS